MKGWLGSLVTALTVLLSLLCGCGSNGSEAPTNYGNLLSSPQGLVLAQEEHPSGWGRADCFFCHEIRTMHTVNRTGIEGLDLAEIRSIVRNQGESSCAQCHGTNGVAP
jgi:hypothetical protein